MVSYIIKHIFGYEYASDYLDDYKNILEFIPQHKQKICEQKFDKSNDLILAVQTFCEKTKLKKFMVSLSGGIDSMVLTTILKLLGYDVICVHINYNNRKETLDEQRFLEQWCYNNNIKLHVKAINEMKRNNTKRSDYECESKKIRFDFYKDILIREDISFIMLGHHKDDIVENIFANVFRGRYILDLAVIRERCLIKDVNIARPMLEFYKKTIYEFAKVYQVPYFKDTTPEWSVRGKYRNKIYPLLEDVFTTNVKENLIVLSNQSDQWNELVSQKIIEPYFKTIIFDLKKCVFNVEEYKDYPLCFWNVIFMKIFNNYGKSCPSRKAILVFMNSIKIKNVGFISLANCSICRNKNYEVTITF